MSKKKLKYEYQVNKSLGKIQPIDTKSAFDSSYQDADMSAIDRFSQKAKELNRLQGKFVEGEANEIQTITNLLVLGFVSGVESYLREVIRRTILIDVSSKLNCLSLPVSYGAATNYSGVHLPEALMESYTFISSKNIKESLKEVLGIAREYPSNLEASFEAYDVVCQMRHCIVHRYGRLGSRNAINLGLDAHKSYLEKPLKIGFVELQHIINACHSVVYDLNNFIFVKVLSRTIDEKTVNWTWNFAHDKTTFRNYFNIYYENDVAKVKEDELKSAYSALRTIAKANTV